MPAFLRIGDAAINPDLVKFIRPCGGDPSAMVVVFTTGPEESFSGADAEALREYVRSLPRAAWVPPTLDVGMGPLPARPSAGFDAATANRGMPAWPPQDPAPAVASGAIDEAVGRRVEAEEESNS
jgi:hypothetical protein